MPYAKSHYRGLLIFSADNTKSVKAVADGEVSHIDMRSGYGLIILLNKDGIIATYSGFSEIYVKKVSKSIKVQLLKT